MLLKNIFAPMFSQLLKPKKSLLKIPLFYLNV